MGGTASLGMYYLMSIILNNSYATLETRLLQSFFNIFTLIPFSIIGLGCVMLVWCIFFHKFEVIRRQIVVFSILVMVVGFSIFGFYLLD